MGKLLKWWQVTIKVFLHIKTIQMLSGKETSDWATTALAHIPFSSSTIKSGYFNTSHWFTCAVVADIEKDGKCPFFPSYQLLWTQMTAIANLPYDYRFGSSLQFGNYPWQHKPELSGCQVTWTLPGRIPAEKTDRGYSVDEFGGFFSFKTLIHRCWWKRGHTHSLLLYVIK